MMLDKISTQLLVIPWTGGNSRYLEIVKEKLIEFQKCNPGFTIEWDYRIARNGLQPAEVLFWSSHVIAYYRFGEIVMQALSQLNDEQRKNPII